MTRLLAALALGFVACGAAAQIPAGAPLRDGLPTLAPILEKVTPAVVNIAVLQVSPEEDCTANACVAFRLSVTTASVGSLLVTLAVIASGPGPTCPPCAELSVSATSVVGVEVRIRLRPAML